MHRDAADARASAGKPRGAERSNERALELRPARAAVGRFQDSRAVVTVARVILLTRPHIHNVRLEGASAIDPMESEAWSSVRGIQFCPPSVVFHTPPPDAPI